MTTMSDPTLGLLIEVGVESFSRDGLDTLLMRSDLAQYCTASESKYKLLRSSLVGARDRASEIDQQARRGLVTFVCLMVESRRLNNYRVEEIREALLADGYELIIDESTGRVRLLSTDAAPVPLAPEISALEAELEERGYSTVLKHYRHAVDGLVNHKYESANGDLRTTLEDLVTRLAEEHTGYLRKTDSRTGQPQANQGGSAVNHMVTAGHLPEREGGKLLQGLWSLSNTNGPHPGQSDADEVRFRMQVVTAVARFLLKHFPQTA